MLAKSREEYIEVCLRSLGHPVIKINIDNDQIDDRVDEALKYYQTYHYNAVERVFLPHKITQDNIDKGHIVVGPMIMSINKILPMGSGSLAKHWMSNLGQSFYNARWDLAFGTTGSAGMGNITDYELTMQRLRQIEVTFGDEFRQFNFNYRSHKLAIFTDWRETFSVDEFLLCDAYQIVDPDAYEDVWNDEWLVEYGSALIGRQWGVNLSKYNNVELPGGTMLDGDKIHERYDSKINMLREEMSSKWEYPVNMLIG